MNYKKVEEIMSHPQGKINTVVRDMLESMKRNGFEIDSPYALENFLQDYADNSKVWAVLVEMGEVER